MSTPPARQRDVRLDFFRGIAMFIIFMAHLPGNWWTLWIPARFGFSDATEIFVFCSGMASAIAFGAVFRYQGWFMGAARITYRVWQVYWAHVILFIVIAAMLVVFDTVLALENYSFVGRLNLFKFFNDPMPQLVGLLTLTYVPNYFDILPMYLVILAMVPAVMFLAKIDKRLVVAFVAVLWILAFTEVVRFPAEPWSDREWFFNPFGWQLIFFTGFAFMAGWIKPPPVDRRLVIAALAIVLITLPIAYFRLYNEFQVFKDIREFLRPMIQKTDFGLFRYIHFLAVAYLAWVAVGEGGKYLQRGGAVGVAINLIRKVGQQSLATFMVGLVLSRFMGMVLLLIGKNAFTVAFVNLLGCAILIGTAFLVAWYKSTPWKSKGTARRDTSGPSHPAGQSTTPSTPNPAVPATSPAE